MCEGKTVNLLLIIEGGYEMFNYLYKKYKVNVLNVNYWKAFSEMKLYEKIGLITTILGTISLAICALWRCVLWSCVSIVIIIVGFMLIMAFRSSKAEQKRILDEIIEPSAVDRMNKMVGLLQSFDIDYTDEKQLDGLILQAREEQKLYDVWKGVKSKVNGFTTYILLPMITIFLSEYFKGVDLETLVARALVFLLLCITTVILISAFVTDANELFNPDIRNLDRFIRDIEDIKVFSNKASRIDKTETNIA